MRRRRNRRIPKKFRAPKSKYLLITAKKVGVLALILSIVAAFCWLALSDAFRIKKIYCLHNENPCNENIKAELKRLIGKSILTLRPDQVENKLLKAEVSVSEVSIKPELPQTLRATLTSRNLSFSISTASDSAQILVDQDNVSFSVDVNPQSHPQIISPKATSILLGEKITEPSLLKAIELVSTLQKYYVSFEFVEDFQNRLQVVLKKGPKVIISPDTDLEKAIPSLQLILRKITIGPKPKEVDLRFEKPVLRY